MRRDMDLIRGILTTVADSSIPVDAHALADADHPFPQVAYHVSSSRKPDSPRRTSSTPRPASPWRASAH